MSDERFVLDNQKVEGERFILEAPGTEYKDRRFVLESSGFPTPIPEQEAIQPTGGLDALIMSLAFPGGGKAFNFLSSLLTLEGAERLRERFPEHPILSDIAALLLSGGAAVGGSALQKGIPHVRIPKSEFPELPQSKELVPAKPRTGEELFIPEGMFGGPKPSETTIIMKPTIKDVPIITPEDITIKQEEIQVAPKPLHYGIKERTLEYFYPFSNIPNKEEILLERSRTKALLNDRIPKFIDKTTASIKEYPEEIRNDIFKALDNPELDKDLPAEVLATVRQLRRNTIMLTKAMEAKKLLPEGTVDENRLSGYVHYMYVKHLLGNDRPIIMNKLGRLDLRETMKRNPDLSPAVIQELQRIEDAAIAVPTGMGKMLTDLANFDYQTGLSKLSLGLEAKVIKQFGEIPSGYKKMPESKTYGVLAGHILPKSVVDDLTPLATLSAIYRYDSPFLNKLADFEKQGVTLIKTLKVPFNLPTVIRNITSNPLQIAMSPHSSLHEMPVDVAQGIFGLAKKEPISIWAMRDGVFSTNFTTTELEELVERASHFEQGRLDKFFETIVDSRWAQFYGRIDNVYKYSIYRKLIKQGETRAKAAFEAQKWGMDYSLAPKSIKEARLHAIPFVTYNYKIAPLIIETMKNKPWFIPAISGVGLISEEVSRSLSGMTNDEWRIMKNSLSSYVKEHKTFFVIPGTGINTPFKWINFNYFLPWGFWLDILGDLNRTRSSGLDELKKDIQFFNPYTALADNLGTILSNDTPIDPFTERAIYNKSDPPNIKWKKTFEYIYNGWAPKMLQRFGALGESLAQFGFGDPKDRWGKEKTPAEAALKWIGVEVTSFTPTQLMSIREAKLKELNEEKNRIMKDATIPVEQKMENLKNIVRMKKEVVLGAQSQGLIQDLFKFLYDPYGHSKRKEEFENINLGDENESNKEKP